MTLTGGRQRLKNSQFTQAARAYCAMELLPPLIRETLLDEKDFRMKFGLETEALITLSSGIALDRSKLFDAARAILDGESSVEISDETGTIWSLNDESDEGSNPMLVLSSGNKRSVLPNFTVLSNNQSTRIRALEEVADNVNIPTDNQEIWRDRLEKRALEDDEVVSFDSDMRDTPAYFEKSLRRKIQQGEGTISISLLVPHSMRYFQRLIGPYDQSTSITDYATGAGRIHLKQLAEWRPYEGFLFGLFLSSHSSLTTEICVDRLDKTQLVEAYDFVDKHGDILSRIGALEVGLRILPERQEVKPYLLRLVHRIRDEDVKADTSDFSLYSALFAMVDGELSRTRLMASKPPFYRRLASLSQAALIHRQLFQIGVDYKKISTWALEHYTEYYYMQSLADLRLEPRWTPESALLPQLKTEFLKRILITGTIFSENIGEGELRNSILGNDEQSILWQSQSLNFCLPGPLECAGDSPNPLPDNLARNIEERLANNGIDTSSFVALVNSARIFKITSAHANLAAKALRLGNYTLENLEDNSDLTGTLNGLATVAAVTRSRSLADDLRILVRRYRHDPQYSISMGETMRICLVASAALENLIEWREFVGECFTELSFDEMEPNEGQVLHSNLLVLLNAVPELWVSCSKADASLKALCFR